MFLAVFILVSVLFGVAGLYIGLPVVGATVLDAVLNGKANRPIVVPTSSMPQVLTGQVMEERAQQLCELGFVETGYLAERIGNLSRFHRTFYHQESRTHASITRGVWFPIAVFRTRLEDGTLVCTIEAQGPPWRGNARLQLHRVDASAAVQFERHANWVLMSGTACGTGTVAEAVELMRMEAVIRHGDPSQEPEPTLSSKQAPGSLKVVGHSDRLVIDIERRADSSRARWIGRGIAILGVMLMLVFPALGKFVLDLEFATWIQVSGVLVWVLALVGHKVWLECGLTLTVHNSRIDAVVTGLFAQDHRISLDDLSAVAIDRESLVLTRTGLDRSKDVHFRDFGSDVELAWIAHVIDEALARHRVHAGVEEAPKRAPEALRQMLSSVQRAKQTNDY